MYESPIEIFSVTDYVDKINKQIDEQTENIVLSAVTKVGVNVNKEELIRALKYDRNQYERGYEDGKRNGIEWHPYPDEKPKNNGRYLCVFDDGLLDFAIYADGKWRVLLREVEWWAELPDIPVCRRENAE